MTIEFAERKPKGMTPTELARAADISVPYASQILSTEPGRQRTPSRPLAIHILRKTGWKHPTIVELTDDEIDFLEKLDPWKAEAA